MIHHTGMTFGLLGRRWQELLAGAPQGQKSSGAISSDRGRRLSAHALAWVRGGGATGLIPLVVMLVFVIR
jgi:hypothetical protein